MSSKYAPIAYTADADVRCESCIVEIYGSTTGVDHEGNEIGAIAPWDEWWEPSEEGLQTLYCGTCGEELDEVGEGAEV